ncbi:MAG: hypothetical protein WC875_01785 [Candidatus Absconditabacterales bacterium]
MKKNLFLLFSLYFFVGQPIIIGFLRQESLMFILALINLVAILLITLLYGVRGNNEEAQELPHKEHEKKVVQEARKEHGETHHYEAPHTKKKRTSAGPFLISLLAAVLLFVFTSGASLGVRFLIMFLGGIIIFIIFAMIRGIVYRFWGLFGTRFYIFFLILGLLITAYQFIFQGGETTLGLSQYLVSNITSTTLFGGQSSLSGTNNIYLLTGEGTVLGTGLESGQELTGDLAMIFSGMGNSDAVSGNTDVVIPTGTAEPTIVITPTGKSLTMIDMIKYLLEKYNIPLVTTQNISFTSMSKTSTDYPYFRTAYAQHLIGTTTSPSKLALCDTYIVMKGLLEKWNISYTSATVMQRFRSYAEAQGVLNGCEKGKVVKDSNL